MLLVSGIAGSGKTSVLLQRIAYLFYQQRGSLDASEVFLISPNPVFSHYIASVLPDLGERNPESLTWDEFARRLLAARPGQRPRATCRSPRSPASTGAVRNRSSSTRNDFKDVRVDDEAPHRRRPDPQARRQARPHPRRPPPRHAHARGAARAPGEPAQADGRHRRGARRAGGPRASTSSCASSASVIAPADEQEERALALRYLTDRYADAFAAVENDDWLRIDRIGMRLLGTDGPRAGRVALPEDGAHGPRQPRREVRDDRRGAGLHRRPAGRARALLPAARTSCCWAIRTRPSRRAPPRSTRCARVFQAARGPAGGMPPHDQLPLDPRDHRSCSPACCRPMSERLSISSIQRADDRAGRSSPAHDDAGLRRCPARALMARSGRASDGLAAVIVPRKHRGQTAPAEARRGRGSRAHGRSAPRTARERRGAHARSSWRRASSSTTSSSPTPASARFPTTRCRAVACTPPFPVPPAASRCSRKARLPRCWPRGRSGGGGNARASDSAHAPADSPVCFPRRAGRECYHTSSCDYSKRLAGQTCFCAHNTFFPSRPSRFRRARCLSATTSSATSARPRCSSCAIPTKKWSISARRLSCRASVDLHTHLENSVMRGIVHDVPYTTWVTSMLEKSAKMDVSDWYDSAILGRS